VRLSLVSYQTFAKKHLGPAAGEELEDSHPSRAAEVGTGEVHHLMEDRLKVQVGIVAEVGASNIVVSARTAVEGEELEVTGKLAAEVVVAAN